MLQAMLWLCLSLLTSAMVCGAVSLRERQRPLPKALGSHRSVVASTTGLTAPLAG